MEQGVGLHSVKIANAWEIIKIIVLVQILIASQLTPVAIAVNVMKLMAITLIQTPNLRPMDNALSAGVTIRKVLDSSLWENNAIMALLTEQGVGLHSVKIANVWEMA
jgi:hypothetical protein